MCPSHFDRCFFAPDAAALLVVRIAKGFCVGLVSLGLSLRLGLVLILFYKSSSVLTKVGSKKKQALTDDYKVKTRHTLHGRCFFALSR